MIYEILDPVIWGMTLLVLIMLGSRAWAVETAGARIYRTSTKVRVLTAAAWVSGLALVVLLGIQGGVLLVTSVITKTDPKGTVVLVPINPAPPAPPGAAVPPAGAPADGAVVPAGPGAPTPPAPGAPAGQPPAGG